MLAGRRSPPPAQARPPFGVARVGSSMDDTLTCQIMAVCVTTYRRGKSPISPFCSSAVDRSSSKRQRSILQQVLRRVQSCRRTALCCPTHGGARPQTPRRHPGHRRRPQRRTHALSIRSHLPKQCRCASQRCGRRSRLPARC